LLRSGIVFLGAAKNVSVFRDYHYPADEALVRRLAGSEDWEGAFEELARPLHEALYEAQTFDLLNKLSSLEQLILSLDYVQTQIRQGGLIQLIQNGYTPLLVTVIEAAQALSMSPEICKTLDDALKVFVLNNESLSRETSPEEFSRLYDEFREFEALDQSFEKNLPGLLREIVTHSIVSG
jgi:hypothetical protein